MIRKLKKIHQLASSVCVGLACANCAVLLWDSAGTEQHRGVTFAVALLFGMIGGIVLGVERSLSRIYRSFDTLSGNSPQPEAAGAWVFVYVCLIFGLLLMIVAMGSSLTAIIGRLQEGFHVFG